MFDAIEYVHGLRKHVDACIVEVEFLTTKIKDGSVVGAGREAAIVKTKLQEAKMWLGKVLEEMGSELLHEFRDSSVESEQDVEDGEKFVPCDCSAEEGCEHNEDCAAISRQSEEAAG